MPHQARQRRSCACPRRKRNARAPLAHHREECRYLALVTWVAKPAANAPGGLFRRLQAGIFPCFLFRLPIVFCNHNQLGFREQPPRPQCDGQKVSRVEGHKRRIARRHACGSGGSVAFGNQDRFSLLPADKERPPRVFPPARKHFSPSGSMVWRDTSFPASSWSGTSN